MCIYVQSPLMDPAPYLVHKKPAQATLLHDSTLKPNTAAFFDYPFDSQHASAYHTHAAPVVPNLKYATKGPHPTELVTAYDPTIASTHHGEPNGLVYMDQIFAETAHYHTYVCT